MRIGASFAVAEGICSGARIPEVSEGVVETEGRADAMNNLMEILVDALVKETAP